GGGSRRVGMASSRVDLPEPMSPVSSALSPPSSRCQICLSNVPQLTISTAWRRTPGRACAGSKARSNWAEPLPSLMGPHLSLQRLARIPGIRLEAFVQLPKPLCVDEGAKDARHLVSVVASLEGTEEAEVHHAADVTVHAIPEAGLVGRGGQEQAYHVEDVRRRDDEARLTAHGVVLRELLAQERQRQAQREAVLAPR